MIRVFYFNPFTDPVGFCTVEISFFNSIVFRVVHDPYAEYNIITNIKKRGLCIIN